MSRKPVRLRVKLIFLGGLLLLCVPVSELLVRLLSPQPPSWLEIYRRHPRLPIYTLGTELDESIDTGESQWTVLTDAEGHRVSRTSPGSGATAPWLLCLGDSFSFGQGVNHEDTYVGGLEGQRLNVVNASVGGYGPVQYADVLDDQLTRLEETPPQRVLVASFEGNDFHDCVWSKDLPVVDGVLGGRQGLKFWVKRNSHLYRLVAKAAHRLGFGSAHAEPQKELYQAAKWEEDQLQRARKGYEDAFARIKQSCASREIGLFVLLIPTRAAVETARGTPAPEGFDYALPLRQAEAALAQQGIPHLNLTAALAAEDPELAWFRVDGHLTPRGHELVKEALLQAWGPLRDALAQGSGSQDR